MYLRLAPVTYKTRNSDETRRDTRHETRDTRRCEPMRDKNPNTAYLNSLQSNRDRPFLTHLAIFEPTHGLHLQIACSHHLPHVLSACLGQFGQNLPHSLFNLVTRYPLLRYKDRGSSVVRWARGQNLDPWTIYDCSLATVVSISDVIFVPMRCRGEV
jgi:hypothetical protein